jgi:hypothetical protein
MSKMKHVSMNWHSILEQVQGGGEQNNKIKLIQFAFIFMLFNKGKPMVDYEGFKPLFSFLKLKKHPKKHWSDMVKWEIIEYVHNQVLVGSKYSSSWVHGIEL